MVAGAGGYLLELALPSIHTLLLVASSGACCPDTTPYTGNVHGQWLHAKLLVWVAASGLLAVR